MKKSRIVLFLTAGLALSACNSSPQTGGAQADSGSHGSSGASDTTRSIQGSSSLGTSASGNPAASRSDTTKTGH